MAYQNTGQNICNMIQCPRNTHPLFRSFGLGSETDGIHGLTRSALTVEVKKWYPRVVVKELRIIESNLAGEFEYAVKVEEV